MGKSLQNKSLSRAMAKTLAKLSRREQLRQAEAEIYRRFAVFARFRPLAHGIFEPLCAALPQFDPEILQRVLQLHCARLRYLKAIRQGGARFDLHNHARGEILPSEQADAQRKIDYADRQRDADAHPADKNAPEPVALAPEHAQSLIAELKMAAEEMPSMENKILSAGALGKSKEHTSTSPIMPTNAENFADYAPQLLWDDALDSEDAPLVPAPLPAHDFSAQRAIWDDATIAENSTVYANFLKENIRESVQAQSDAASLAHSANLLFQFVPETLANDAACCPPENQDHAKQAPWLDHFMAAESLDLPTEKSADLPPTSANGADLSLNAANVAADILEMQDLDLRPILSDAPDFIWQKSPPKSPNPPQLVRVGERFLSAKAWQARRDPRLLVAEKLRHLVRDLGGVAPAGQKIARDETPFPAAFAPRHRAARTSLRKTKKAAKRYAAIIKIPPVGIK